MKPTKLMQAGAEILAPLLTKHGFRFKIISEGRGSGGQFCQAEFSKGNRTLELHFRCSLGLVTYHKGKFKVSHQAYMNTLGVKDKCEYPGFSSDPLDGFRHLLADLKKFGSDFLEGDGSILNKSAKEESKLLDKKRNKFTISGVGDQRIRVEARKQFRMKKYREVIKLLKSVKFPGDLSESERKMLEIANRKATPCKKTP